MKLILPLFIFLFLLTACGDDGEKQSELKCESYYLETDNTSGKLFYNSDGLLSEYLNNADTFYIFSYNDQQQIESIEVPTEVLSFFYQFHYDNDHALVAVVEHADSISFEEDSEGRIVTRNYYRADKLIKSLINTYEGQNTSKMEIYNLNTTTQELEKTNTFLYTYDSNPTPYPAELQFANAIISGGHLSVNNPISITHVGEPAGTNEIKYNSDGYPVLINGVEYTYTCEPKPRGVQ